MSFRPMRDKIFVSNLDRGARQTKGGIILTDDTGKDRGIRSRWAQVACIGDDVGDVAVGEWVLIEHGRWTNGIEIEGFEGKLWRIDPEAILLVSDTNPDTNQQINLAERPAQVF